MKCFNPIPWKKKSLSSTIRSAKRVGRPKDGRKETVYAAVINDQTDFRERKTHTGNPSPHRLSVKHQMQERLKAE